MGGDPSWARDMLHTWGDPSWARDTHDWMHPHQATAHLHHDLHFALIQQDDCHHSPATAQGWQCLQQTVHLNTTPHHTISSHHLTPHNFLTPHHTTPYNLLTPHHTTSSHHTTPHNSPHHTTPHHTTSSHHTTPHNLLTPHTLSGRMTEVLLCNRLKSGPKIHFTMREGRGGEGKGNRAEGASARPHSRIA